MVGPPQQVTQQLAGNGVLLCGYHHREIEHGQWELFIGTGRAWFRPPAWIDPARKPILNPMHHPPPT